MIDYIYQVNIRNIKQEVTTLFFIFHNFCTTKSTQKILFINKSHFFLGNFINVYYLSHLNRFFNQINYLKPLHQIRHHRIGLETMSIKMGKTIRLLYMYICMIYMCVFIRDTYILCTFINL